MTRRRRSPSTRRRAHEDGSATQYGAAPASADGDRTTPARRDAPGPAAEGPALETWVSARASPAGHPRVPLLDQDVDRRGPSTGTEPPAARQ